MTGFGDGAHRAAVDAFAAGAVAEEETVSPVIVVGSGGGFQIDPGHYGPGPHGLAPLGNEAVAQTECPQTGGMGGMSFGPGRGIGILLRLNNSPVGNQHGGNGRMAIFLQAFGHMPARNEETTIDNFEFKVINANQRKVDSLALNAGDVAMDRARLRARHELPVGLV